MGAKLDFYKKALKNRVKKGFQSYPVATIAYYGPDDRRATKVAVGIMQDEDDPAELSRWYAETGDIRRNAPVLGHFEELLRLNPNDNQGNRHLLGPCYLDAGRDADALELLNRHPEAITANWTYTMALVHFRLHGNTTRSQSLLRDALKANAHVPEYLCGKKRMPRQLPHSYGLRSVEEAVIYVDLLGKCWKSTPGAIAWLETI